MYKTAEQMDLDSMITQTKSDTFFFLMTEKGKGTGIIGSGLPPAPLTTVVLYEKEGVYYAKKQSGACGTYEEIMSAKTLSTVLKRFMQQITELSSKGTNGIRIITSNGWLIETNWSGKDNEVTLKKGYTETRPFKTKTESIDAIKKCLTMFANKIL